MTPSLSARRSRGRQIPGNPAGRVAYPRPHPGVITAQGTGSELLALAIFFPPLTKFNRSQGRQAAGMRQGIGGGIKEKEESHGGAGTPAAARDARAPAFQTHPAGEEAPLRRGFKFGGHAFRLPPRRTAAGDKPKCVETRNLSCRRRNQPASRPANLRAKKRNRADQGRGTRLRH